MNNVGVGGLIFLVNFAAATNPASATLDSVRKSGILRVGATLDYPPFSLRCKDGSAAGADIDAMDSLARTLGASIEIVPTTWPTLQSDAAQDRFDIAVGGITVTLARLRLVAMVPTGAKSSKIAVARCGNHLLSLPLDDLDESSIRVGVNPGGTNAAFVHDHLPHVKVTSLAQGQQWPSILDGKVNMTVTDSIEARLEALSKPGELCAGARPLSSFSEKGFLLPNRSDVAWRQYVQTWFYKEASTYNHSVDAWLERQANATLHDSWACQHGFAVLGLI
ncbi:unnamed protein product [Effrenium voratum]|nr:unnamed protein product [Effrenium voratum]